MNNIKNTKKNARFLLKTLESKIKIEHKKSVKTMFPGSYLDKILFFKTIKKLLHS